MEIFKPLYRIAIEHDYFNIRKRGSDLSLNLTPQSLQFARRHMLVFRQTAMNEWILLYNSTDSKIDTERDVLEFTLNITDPLFKLYTEWNGLQPTGTYVLQLPANEEEMKKENKVNFMSAIHPSNERSKIGASFCTIQLRLTKELLEAVEAGNSKLDVLHFDVPEVQWEYLFLSRSEEHFLPEELLLEDITGKLKFSAFKECEVFGKKAMRTITEESFPLQENPENRLCLFVLKGQLKMKQTLLRNIPFPQLGLFQNDQSGIIRQICYY